MTAGPLRRAAWLTLAGCCTGLASSCGVFRAAAAPDPATGKDAGTPTQVAQLDYGRHAAFARCVPPACPARTLKTLAAEAPSLPVEHAVSVGSAASVAPAPATPAPATEGELPRTVTLQFGVGSAKLSPAARSQLSRATGELLLAHAITIIGRTDSTGPLALNEALALARAMAVRDHLRKMHPTLPAALALRSRGACCFIASNDTPAGRAQNRRVEVVLGPKRETRP